ncbi:MAG: hypothetical protein ACYSXF_00625 [Planctomycetota bacterium]|jgi:sodium/proline symporter
MATGAVTVVGRANLEGGMFDVYEILPSFLAGFAAMVVVSLLGREPPPKVRETFSRA